MILTLVTGLLLLSQVWAQSYFTIDPASVSSATRTSWCAAEIQACGTLCTDQEDSTNNVCDESTLDYHCTCSSGYSPLMQYYANTIPTLICDQYYSQCVTENAGNANGQKNCTETIGQFCATKQPAPLDSSSSSVTSSAASTASTASSSASSTSSSKTSTSLSSTSSPPAAQSVLPSNSTGNSTGNSSDASAAGLSPGAKAGIGVGVAIGGLIALTVGFYIGYRAFQRRQLRKQAALDAFQKPELGDTQIGRHQAPWMNESGGAEIAELDGASAPAELRVATVPMETEMGTSELHGTSHIQNDGNTVRQIYQQHSTEAPSV